MFKCKLWIILFVSIIMLVSSEDLSGSRKPRIFTFNTDAEDVEVGLDFSIPFLKIPFKKTFNAVAQYGFPGISLPRINFNPVALALGGLLIVTTSIFAPLLNKATGWHHFDRTSRLGDNESIEATSFRTENLLTNSRGCPERIACWSTQKTKSPEMMTTLKQIIRNKLLSTMVNTTALEIATLKGQSGHNCELYAPCPIYEKNLPNILKSFAILTDLNKF